MGIEDAIGHNQRSRKKSFFPLYTERTTLEEAIELSKKMSKKISSAHLYSCKTMRCTCFHTRPSWSAFSNCSRGLSNEFGIWIWKISLAWLTLVTQLELQCPICVENIGEDVSLQKEVISFLNDDKIYDHQQIRDYEVPMFEIIHEKLGRPITSWRDFQMVVMVSFGWDSVWLI